MEIPIPDPGNTDRTLYCNTETMLENKSKTPVNSQKTKTMNMSQSISPKQLRGNLLNICDVHQLDDFILLGGARSRAGTLEADVAVHVENKHTS